MSAYDPIIRVAILVGYLCGSIPFGLLFTRMAGLGDIRSIGSGNIGATNVLRTGRRGLAFATLLADALKATMDKLQDFAATDDLVLTLDAKTGMIRHATHTKHVSVNGQSQVTTETYAVVE